MGLFDETYRAGHKEVAELELKRHELVRNLSMNHFVMDGGDDEAWSIEDKARTLREEQNSLELKNTLLQEYVERMTFPGGDKAKTHRKWIMEMLISMPASKGGMSGRYGGPREKANLASSAFRASLEDACSSKHPDEAYNEQWCPIIGSWMPESSIKVTHIFPYVVGQTAMDELFGRDDEDRAELFEPENGLMMCDEAEKRIANGWKVLVPDVPVDASAGELDAWAQLKVKGYKLRVLCPDNRLMRQVVSSISASNEPQGKQRLWRELDGQQVQFTSNHRPRARYLYWQFAISLLRQAWQTDHRKSNPVAAEIGKPFWSTRGRWIKRKYLLGFPEYLGHAVEWNNLLEAAILTEDDDDKPDPGGLVLASEKLRVTRKKLAKGWVKKDEDGDEDEDEDENDSEHVELE